MPTTAASRVTAKVLSLAIGLALTVAWLTADANPIPPDGLSLGLSMGSPAEQQQQPPAPLAATRSRLVEQMLADEQLGEFQLTSEALSQLRSILDEFATREQLTDTVSSPLNTWAATRGLQLDQTRLGPMAAELDFLLLHFWTELKPLVEMFTGGRIQSVKSDELDFRCRQGAELTRLKALGEQSALVRMLLDTFFSELHSHCLLRKLAMIKLHNIQPSALVKQFVEIYLDLPTGRHSGQATREELEAINSKLLGGMATHFQLAESFVRHGPLEAAAKLVFDPRTALLMGGAGAMEDLVRQFRADCQSYSIALGNIWTNFDSVAEFFTSPMSDIATYNEQVKLVAPQLVYSSICNQLMKL